MKFEDSKVILQEVNIINVVREFINLKKKGNNYLGLCPFHNDSKPSLSVSETKQFFKCFACDTGGNAIKFVMLFKNLSWKKAILWLSKKFKISISEELIENLKLSLLAKEIINVNEEANFFFQMNLIRDRNRQAMKYCKQRKISQKIIKEFQIGWMGKESQEILQYFTKKEIEKAKLINSNLFLLDQKNQMFSYFKKRLIFPILDENGNLSGFSGRLIEVNKNEQQPKYLNSRESEVFKKQQILYNFFYITQKFKAIKTIYLVEGLIDSIRMNINKYPTIALMGVSLSQYQVNLIKERYKKVIIFPDHDQAGITSAIKNAEILMRNKIEIEIINQKMKLDPDLCLQETNFNLQTTEKLHPIDFLLKKNEKLEDIKATKQLFQKIKLFIPHIGHLELFHFLQKIQEKYSIPIKIIEKELKITSLKEEKLPETNLTEPRWKTFFFVTILYHPEIIAKTIKIDGFFNQSEYDYYYHLLIEWYNAETEKSKLTFINFLCFLEKKELIEVKKKISSIYKLKKDNVEIKIQKLAIINDYLNKWRREKLTFELKTIEEKMKQNENQNNIDLLIKLQKKQVEINKLKWIKTTPRGEQNITVTKK